MDDRRLDDFMPAIRAVVAEMSPEDMAKRLVLRDFARFLTDYKDAPDLNATAGADRRDNRERGDRRGSSERRLDSDAARFRINLGNRNELTPAALITLINRATRGPMLRVGRIQIMDQASVFEMLPDDARTVLPFLNGSVFNEREVRVVPVEGNNRGPGAPYRRSGPPPASRFKRAASRPYSRD